MTELDKRFEKACKEGKIKEANKLIKKGANANWGLEEACKAGQKKMALLMLEKGATHVNLGLYGACLGGQKEMALLMLKKGANPALMKDKEIIKWLIEKGKK